MDYTEIKSCRGCHAGNAELEAVLEMSPMPLAGQFCATKEDALTASAYPLTWVQCRNCGLVQALEDVRDDLLFSKYNYASSTVGGLVRHFEGYASFLGERFGESEEISLAEIGCNDGVLLSKLPDDWRLTGVDPSDVAKSAAEGQSHYELLNEAWSADRVRELGWENRYNVITGSNCLAHITDLRDVFEGVALALKPGGEFWIEVHDLAATLSGAQWDTIYHEHKAEWSEDALRRCLAPLGLALRETHRLPLHGGLLRCGFEKTGQADVSSSKTTDSAPGLAALANAYSRRREHASVQKLLAAKSAGQTIAAYGAAGRANVFLNQIPELEPAYIVDESPLRAGKFLPRVATPVVGRERLAEEHASHCLVTAWNYLDDIVEKNPDYQGEWLTAFG